ncbi:hypothetical protein RvY_13391 [Ramazzottius varieornatus]|uniref:Uncharacterized protein n=1 Tax=Ramazzottius varieornatus TaxID=947166 RepID=A0A1D1VV77_RAMVA|nr:hypothetical protein RvY_13391 [Ramazzottius varieornatus]
MNVIWTVQAATADVNGTRHDDPLAPPNPVLTISRRTGFRMTFRVLSHVLADQVMVLLGLWALMIVDLLRSINTKLQSMEETKCDSLKVSTQCDLMGTLMERYEDVRDLWEKINSSFMLLHGVAYGSDVTAMLGYVISGIGSLSPKKQQELSIPFGVLFLSQAVSVSFRILIMSLPLIMVYEEHRLNTTFPEEKRTADDSEVKVGAHLLKNLVQTSDGGNLPFA